MKLRDRMRALQTAGRLDLPFPGKGATPLRHRKLAEIGREDLSLARLTEAHLDALAILEDAGRSPEPIALYGVWASETPNQPLRLESGPRGRLVLNGPKMFCTGAGIIDRALITVHDPQQRLIDVDLRVPASAALRFNPNGWITPAFADTQTAEAYFTDFEVTTDDIIGAPCWYLDRPGFWHGACGPAACWAGGAIGLVDHTREWPLRDAHAAAHQGAMRASVWALWAYLDKAGCEIDARPDDFNAALSRALSVRHLIEQTCTDILRHFGRAYGPRPLAFDPEISRRSSELELYIRQSHAERDLETLGRCPHA